MPNQTVEDSPTFKNGDRSNRKAVETGDFLAIDFNSKGLVPVFVAEVETGRPLMLAWANMEALEATVRTGEAHYYSRSRQTLWHKGATSGEIQKVHDIRIDCDQDAVFYSVTQLGGGCCHVGMPSCFFRRVPLGSTADPSGLVRLERVDNP